RRVSPADHRAGRRLLSRRASQIGVIELSSPVADDAGDLADQFALTGADAVHLASGLAVSDDEAVFLTWDRRLEQLPPPPASRCSRRPSSRNTTGTRAGG